jgi:hypothetical protein
MATISRVGFGQVEPNHLSAQRTGQIYAQLPADDTIKILENGQFVKYDYAESKVDFTGKGEWMLVFNEVKLYDDYWRESYKDFALIKENYTPGSYKIGEGAETVVTHDGFSLPGQMVPRVFKTNVGDIFTTNCLEKANTSGKATVEGTEDITVGTELSPNEAGYLSTSGDETVKFQVVKIYTLADGQAAVKVMRIA